MMSNRCPCGAEVEWPEGSHTELVYSGEATLFFAQCPRCRKPVALATAPPLSVRHIHGEKPMAGECSLYFPDIVVPAR